MTISRRDALGVGAFLLVLPVTASAQGSPAVIDIELRPPAAVVLPTGAVAKLRLFEGGVADHPNPPVYGRAEIPVGGLALPARLKLPISDAAGLARAMAPAISIRIENSAGRLLFVNQRRTVYNPGVAQHVMLAPIVP
jgi:hypothetical protein